MASIKFCQIKLQSSFGFSLRRNQAQKQFSYVVDVARTSPRRGWRATSLASTKRSGRCLAAAWMLRSIIPWRRIKKSRRFTAPYKRDEVLAEFQAAKMVRSAHAYVRGSTAKFYEWFVAPKPYSLPEGPSMWICGDCHAGNLGPLANARGRVNTDPGPESNGYWVTGTWTSPPGIIAGDGRL